MAIFSLSMGLVGKLDYAGKEKQKNTASAHIRYISREATEPTIIAHGMSSDPAEACRFLDNEERLGRKNMRVIEKLRIALPRELTEKQRAQLLKEYLVELTGDKVPYFAAIHQRGSDSHNPHCHVVLRDGALKDLEMGKPKTGKRVLCFSDSTRDRKDKNLPGPTAAEFVRLKWEQHINRALEKYGHESRVSRLSLKAQGITDRKPTIHLGPNGQYVEKNVRRPESKVVTFAKSGKEIDYPMKDAGRTRKEINDGIIDLNLEKAARSQDFETRSWAQFEKEQRLLDRNVDNQIIPQARQQTLEERRLREGFKKQIDQQYALLNADKKLRKSWLRVENAPTLEEINEKQRKELDDHDKKQKWYKPRLWYTVMEMFTGVHEPTKTELKATHRSVRNDFKQSYGEKQDKSDKEAEERSKSKIVVVKDQRRNSLKEFREKNKGTLKRQDALLQARADERELARRELEKTIEEWKQREKERTKEPERAQSQARGRVRERKRSRGPDYDPS